MKNLVIIIISMLIFYATKMWAQTTSSCPVRFEKNIHDFGLLETPWDVIYWFKFTNITSDTQWINKTEAYCGCTTPFYNKKPILPHATDSIKITFYPRNTWDTFDKDILIYFRGYENPETLTVQGRVNRLKF